MTVAAVAALGSVGTVAMAAEPTVLILPFDQPAKAHRDLGFGVELKVTGALRALGGVNLVHPKIRDSVIRRHTATAALPAPERQQAYAGFVGASWILTGQVVDAPKAKIVLRLAQAKGAKVIAEETHGPTLAAAIGALPDAVRTLLNATDGGRRAYTAPMTPATAQPEVLARLGTCYRMLNDQSVGIRKPALLNDERVFQAGNRCRAALRREPELAEAQAGLAMVDALEGRADDAKARLARIKDHPGFLAYYWVAKFWVLAKFFSPAQAVDALKAATERDPGFMLGRGYLGEALSVMSQHEQALSVYRAYLARVPEQPFVMTRIGHELARLGRHEAAIEASRKALRIDPDNAEARLQLGSRLIDGKRYDEAIDVLDGLVKNVDARGEIYLRLGFAQLRAQRLADAERSFRTALDKATEPQEWKTRGRAHYDLAKIHARQNKLDVALSDLKNAVDAGFQAPDVFVNDPDLAALRGDERFAALLARTPPRPEIPVRYESPFVVDADEVAKAATEGGLKIPSRAAVDF